MKSSLLWLAVLACADSTARGRAESGPVEVATLDGEITWEVDFDAIAEDAGQVDCTYTRTYAGTEDRSAPWLCPDCASIYVADVAVIEGRDCYDLIADNPPEPVEWVGTGEGRWFRTSGLHYRLTEQGAASWDGEALSTSYLSEDYDLPEGGSFTLGVQGALGQGVDVADPFHGWRAPGAYTCGWPKANPPSFDGAYRFEVGRTLPDGVFGDRCGEPVRLHDFRGRYLVLAVSALDCPPCQDMAASEPDFLRDLRARGVEVEVITLLAPSLSAPLDETGIEVLNSWIQGFDLTSPVLADRGYGYWMGVDALGDGFGYPMILTVSPDLKVMDLRSGFGGWSTWEALILEN